MSVCVITCLNILVKQWIHIMIMWYGGVHVQDISRTQTGADGGGPWDDQNHHGEGMLLCLHQPQGEMERLLIARVPWAKNFIIENHWSIMPTMLYLLHHRCGMRIGLVQRQILVLMTVLYTGTHRNSNSQTLWGLWRMDWLQSKMKGGREFGVRYLRPSLVDSWDG